MYVCKWRIKSIYLQQFWFIIVYKVLLKEYFYKSRQTETSDSSSKHTVISAIIFLFLFPFFIQCSFKHISLVHTGFAFRSGLCYSVNNCCCCWCGPVNNADMASFWSFTQSCTTINTLSLTTILPIKLKTDLRSKASQNLTS